MTNYDLTTEELNAMLDEMAEEAYGQWAMEQGFPF